MKGAVFLGLLLGIVVNECQIFASTDDSTFLREISKRAKAQIDKVAKDLPESVPKNSMQVVKRKVRNFVNDIKKVEKTVEKLARNAGLDNKSIQSMRKAFQKVQRQIEQKLDDPKRNYLTSGLDVARSGLSLAGVMVQEVLRLASKTRKDVTGLAYGVMKGTIAAADALMDNIITLEV